MLEGEMSASGDMNVAFATGIVSAYVRNNTLQTSELPALIRNVHAALMDLSRPVAAAPEPPAPAVPVKRSIFKDYIICLEDGQKFKSLKRHLRSKYGLSPEDYRQKWGLPADYPMVAPGYSEKRSKLAKKMGLGRSAKEE
ncbi:MAG: transcriptional regulator [Hyphomonas sp.]|uniref:MucR family transcriptional regulator n=1 Tax=Hyphomonas sp. TaxID=87 RepID=UPI0017F343D3|nr:MucR family transcriptional regulator [Hyphomonas sp.]MBA3067727.1 transcriptional regulator [Hyphomonas sp.]MBU3921979.1 MucR family transcriptional regulator [Alphaproteobacteria bacterium]MBU4062185.1 MucR family transcriptional regulator [Alphaproteobacteria bacterium]MBU4165620.1 MucR family transcriptional regulator [Alphaproteobacteria bacterium]